jgi:hypothetical protein
MILFQHFLFSPFSIVPCPILPLQCCVPYPILPLQRCS